jgi:hypothetical protein
MLLGEVSRPGSVGSIYGRTIYLSERLLDPRATDRGLDGSELSMATRATVPEPSIWVMMLIGFLGLGFMPQPGIARKMREGIISE